MNHFFDSPMPLYLFAAYLTALGFWTWRRIKTSARISARRRILRSFGLHTLAAACILAAAAGAKLPARAKQLDLVVAADVSDSVFDQSTQSARLGELLKSLDPEASRVGMVVFGKTAGTEQPLAPILEYSGGRMRTRALPNLSRVSTVVDRSATDIAKAIEVSRSLFPQHDSSSGRAILLLSDFRDTRGQADTAAAGLSGSGIDLLAAPTVLTAASDVRIAELRVPEEARIGRSIPIEVKVAGAAAQNSQVQVVVWSRRAGREPQRVGSQSVTLSPQPGATDGEMSATVRIIDTPDTPGTQIYSARISGPDGAELPGDIAVNNQLSGAVRVVAPSRWALLTHGGSTLAQLCTRNPVALGVETRVYLPRQFPKQAGEYKSCTGILLDGLAANEMKADVQDAIAQAAEGGKAVVALGGENAFGAGGHKPDSPLERILPAEMTPEDDRTRSILFLIDVSQSMDDLMNEQGSSVRKLHFAADQLAQAVQKLKSTDRLGMISFSGTANVSAPLSNDSARASFLQAIKDIKIVSNTDLYPALLQAREVLKNDNAEEQLVVMITDGIQTVERAREQIIQAAHELCPVEAGRPRRRTTLYTFGIGTSPQDSNPTGEALLKDLAAAGGGEYSPDFLKLGQRLEKTLESEKKDFYYRRESFTATFAHEQPLQITGGPAWPLLKFRNRIKPKTGADVALWSGAANENTPGQRRPDPLLILSGPTSTDLSRRAALALSTDGDDAAWLNSPGAQKLLPAVIEWAEAKESGKSNWALNTGRTNDDGLELTAIGRDRNSGEWLNGRSPMAILTPVLIEDSSGAAVASNIPERIDLRADAPGVYRGQTRLPAQGIYRLTLLDGKQTLYERFLSIPYPEEYHKFGTDRAAMRSLVLKAGGTSRVIENPLDLSEWLKSQNDSSGDYSLRPWLLIAGLCLFLAEFALRGLRARA